MPGLMRKPSVVEFQIKTNTPAKALTVEGYANKAILDRGGDIIPSEAWTVDEFKKINTVLFNHNQDIPIGTAEVKVVKDGLYAKAKISKSNEAPLPYIRDMIKEGILKAFSVGFDDKRSTERQADGSSIIKKANLLELSVVSVPMNQESTFSVIDEINKAVGSWRTKSYHEARNDILRFKGAFLAGAVHDRISLLQESEPEFDRDRIFDRIIEQSGLPEEVLNDVLAGNTTQVPDALFNAISENFNLDSLELRSLNQRDAKASGGYGAQTQEPPKDDTQDEQPTLVPPPQGQEEDVPQDGEKPKVEPSQVTTEEDQPKEPKKSEDASKSYQEIVIDRIDALMEQGATSDQAIASAIFQAQELLGIKSVSTLDYSAFIKHADKISQKKSVKTTINLDQSSSALENAQTSNPSMDQMKAQTTLLAEMGGVFKAVLEEIRGLRTDLQTERSRPQSQDNQASQQEESLKRALDARKKLMEQFEKQISEIEKSIL